MNTVGHTGTVLVRHSGGSGLTQVRALAVQKSFCNHLTASSRSFYSNCLNLTSCVMGTKQEGQAECDAQ